MVIIYLWMTLSNREDWIYAMLVNTTIITDHDVRSVVVT